MPINRIRGEGGVYTPLHIVSYMLDILPYKTNICGKHIMETSCGDGAFLCEIVARYCNVFDGNKSALKSALEKFIHGVEINKQEWEKCIFKLNAIAESFGATHINWDIHNDDALKILPRYYGRIDFVGFNPPYVKIHNLQQNLSNFSFCAEGMTDLYLAFFEIGLKLLSPTGRMIYITPNTFFNSVAGRKFRDHLHTTKCLSHIVDTSNQHIFDAAVHTIITKYDTTAHAHIKYKIYNDKEVQTIPYDKLFIDNKIVVSNNQLMLDINKAYIPSQMLVVKNGFATLADEVFIADDFPFDDFVIDVYKASKKVWKKCLFPYQNNTPVDFFELPAEMREYLTAHKKILTRNIREKKIKWWIFGHSQGVKDVAKKRYAINSLIRCKEDICIQTIPPGKGIYSGLYILAPSFSVATIKKWLCTNEFIDYVKALKKHKMGGYFTFSSKDLEKYLVYISLKTAKSSLALL